ncbi:hypothetical protein WN943_020236 [Citrus x changshan-huyou]
MCSIVQKLMSLSCFLDFEDDLFMSQEKKGPEAGFSALINALLKVKHSHRNVSTYCFHLAPIQHCELKTVATLDGFLSPCEMKRGNDIKIQKISPHRPVTRDGNGHRPQRVHVPSLDWPFNLEEEAFDGPFGAQLRKRVLHSALSVEVADFNLEASLWYMEVTLVTTPPTPAGKQDSSLLD